MSIQKRMFAAVRGAVLLSCLLAVPVFAQTYTLSGKVIDTAGHAVPSATVTAKSVATRKSFTAITNSEGMYSIHDLAGGDYQVSARRGRIAGSADQDNAGCRANHRPHGQPCTRFAQTARFPLMASN